MHTREMKRVLAAAVLAAPQLPTTYRQLVLLPPIGLLAVLGLDRVLDLAADRPRRVRAALAAVLVVAALPLAAPLVTLTRALAADGPALDLGDARRLAVGDRIGGSPMVGPAAVMRSTIPPGTAIYVLGDPVVYRVLGARQAIEMNGWGPEIMSPRMWSETLRELRRSRPEWVFVEQDYQSYIDRAPGVTAFLSQAYTATTPLGAEGVWWHTATPGRPAPSVEGNLLARG